MRTKLLFGGLLAVVAFVGLPSFIGAQGQDVKADYDRASGLAERVRNKIYDVAEAPNWIEHTDKFWYRKSVKGGNSFVLVDPATSTKAPAFDHAKLAAAISTAAGGNYTALALPFATFTYGSDLQSIEFALMPGGGRGGAGRAAGAGRGGAPGQPEPPRYRCTLTDYKCERLAPTSGPAGAGQGRAGGGQGRGGGGRAGGAAGLAAETPVRVSPDGRTEAFIENYNVYLRAVGNGGRPAPATALSYDGSEANSYTFHSIQWSPDSKKIAAYRRRPGYQRMVNYVQSSPPDQLQPKSSSRFYQKPGDVVDLDQPCCSTWRRSSRSSWTTRSFRTRIRSPRWCGARTAAPSRSSTTSAGTSCTA